MSIIERPFAAYKGKENFLFVSYSHQNSGLVFAELAWLHDHGINIWYDEGIEVGTEWRDEIARAIKNASVFLYFVTPASAQSENCRREINYASEQGIPIIAIYLEPTELPGGLSMTLSERQGMFKYKMAPSEYVDKLASQLGSYLELEKQISPRAVQISPRKNMKPFLLASALLLVLVVSTALLYLFFGTQNGAEIPGPLQTASTDSNAKPVKDEAWFNARKSIAVLPFVNLSTSAETGFFARGLSEEILDNLAQVPYYNIASRTASFQAADRGDALPEIARSLNVDYALEGSVRQSGSDLRITAQLIRASDNFHIWSKTYDRAADGGFKMQTEVADNIAHIVESYVDLDVHRQYAADVFPEYASSNPLAIKYFWDAQEQWDLMALGEGGDIMVAERFTQLAVEADPDFAMGWADLANLYLNRLDGRLTVAEASPKAHAAIDKAIALDPASQTTLFQAGQLYYVLDWDYQRAEQALKQVLEKNPKCGWCYMMLAGISVREGRIAASGSYLSSASVMDWGSEANYYLAIVAEQYAFDDPDKSIEVCQQAINLVSGGERAHILTIMALPLLASGRIDDAKNAMAEARKLAPRADGELMAYYYARIGDEDTARGLLLELGNTSRERGFLIAAQIQLGDIEQAFALIQAGIEQHDMTVADMLRRHPLYEPIRSDPRYPAMVSLLESQEIHTDAWKQARAVARPG